MNAETTLPVEQALRLIVDSRGKRISWARIGARTVWIKRFDAEKLPWTKRLHGALSPILPVGLRSSRLVDAAAMRDRERRKARAFRQAGFSVPQTLHESDNATIMSDAAPTLDGELQRRRKDDPDSHDELLVAMVSSLARAHASELCHGRPHPRDMFLSGGEIGFLDFEEEPEAVMPLPAAQARDAWLIFMHVGGRAMDVAAEDKAVAAYRRHVPAAVMAELRKLVRFFSRLLPLLRALRPLGLGSDGRRVLAATELLHASLSADRGLRSRKDGASQSACRTKT